MDHIRLIASDMDATKAGDWSSDVCSSDLEKVYHLERTLWRCQQPHRLRTVAGHLHGTPARL